MSDNVKEQYIKLFGDAKSELLVIYNLIDRSELLSKWDWCRYNRKGNLHYVVLED